MTTTSDRVAAGLGSIPETYFEQACDAASILYVSTKKLSIYNSIIDQIHGDYIVVPKDIRHRVMRIDVKGHMISKESIEQFHGDYFVIYDASNGSAKNPYVYKAEVLKELVSNLDDSVYSLLPYSGKPGLIYDQLTPPKYNHPIPLEEFLQKF